MGPSYTALSCVQAHNHHSALVQQWSQALGMGGEMSLSCLWLSLAHGAHSQCGLSNGDVAGANGPVPVDTNEPGCNYVDT